MKKKGKTNKKRPVEQRLRQRWAALGAAAAAKEKLRREIYINPPACGSEADVLSGKTLPLQLPPLEFITEAPPCQSFSGVHNKTRTALNSLVQMVARRGLSIASEAATFTCPECGAELWHIQHPPKTYRMYLHRLDVATSACQVCGYKATHHEWLKYRTIEKEWRPKIHWLKILPRYFHALSTRRKSFELRFNDRDYRVGDNVIFQMWSPAAGMHGRTLPMTITYITDYPEGLRPGYVVLGVKPL